MPLLVEMRNPALKNLRIVKPFFRFWLCVLVLPTHSVTHALGIGAVLSTVTIGQSTRVFGINSGCLLSGARMRISELRSFILVFTCLPLLAPAVAQKQLAQSPRILSAKSVYFNNQTGSDAVGKNALEQLKKWGKFQLLADPKQADLIIFLSADPYKDGNIVFASGQTGRIDDGRITEDTVPNYNKQSPTRYAYLTVIDRKTGENLWSDKHLWGGLLTGFNSVGERLIKELEKQSKK